MGRNLTTSFGMLGIVSSHRNGYKWLEITVSIASTQRELERKSGWINSPKKDQKSAKKTLGFLANPLFQFHIVLRVNF